MESLFAIGIGLVMRLVLDVVTDNDDRVSGVLVGLWEGVVLNHFVRRIPHSFDPYLGFGFRIFVDFLFTQSLSRLALVALWSLVGMLLADIAPNIWRDSGFRHLYRQVCKDVRHAKRAVPRIRIKNDLPSVRLFNRSRSASSEVSDSIRSDRATPSRSPVPTPAPMPGPARRPGRSPPGTLPDMSGWSETATDVSVLRERVVVTPGPSPSLIPSREHATYAHADATHAATSQTQRNVVQDTTVTITQTQNESVVMQTTIDTAALSAAVVSTSTEPPDDPSRHNPPTIPDDWVDITRPAPAQSTEPVPPFQPDPDSTPDSHPGTSTLDQPRPISIVEPPAVDVLPDIPDVDHGNRGTRSPDQIPLPESRAASVIGGVFDQPQPRSALRDSHRSRVEKATSEVGVAASKSFATHVTSQTTKTHSTSRSWFGSSRTRTKLKESVEVEEAPEVPLRETQAELTDRSKLDLGRIVLNPEPPLPTPAQPDAPANILTQPGDSSPLLFKPSAPEPEQQKEQPIVGKPDLTPMDDAGVDTSPASPRAGAEKEKGDTAGPSKSVFDLPSPSRTPPPPFSEFAGVIETFAAGEAPAEQDPLVQDQGSTELTEEQKAAEKKRLAFLMTQVEELEGSRADLQMRLEKQDDARSRPAMDIESDLKDAEKSLSDIRARIAKTKFSEPPSDPSVLEVSLAGRSTTDVQFAITSAILDVLLKRDDAGPMTIQAVINKQSRPLKSKAKETKDVVNNLAKRHQFTTRFESATPGIINITF